MALGRDVEGLQQWHPGLHHRRQLTGKQRDILFGNALPQAGAALLQLGRANPLPSQLGTGDGFRLGTNFPADGLAGPVAPFPDKDMGGGLLAWRGHSDRLSVIRW
ncbi:hypothetical protein D3C71_1810410 [compost metagenome]